MTAAQAIQERTDRFVEEILDLIRRVQQEHRAAALRAVTTMLTGAGSLATSPSSKRRNGTALIKQSQAAPAKGTQARSPRTTAASAPKTLEPTSIPNPIPAGTTAEPAPSERELVILEAVRVLVRGTTTQIAKRCELPNGSVYVSLRALVGRGKVARAEIARGIEYSLVSSGEIRPFKRMRAATSTSA